MGSLYRHTVLPKSLTQADFYLKAQMRNIDESGKVSFSTLFRDRAREKRREKAKKTRGDVTVLCIPTGLEPPKIHKLLQGNNLDG